MCPPIETQAENGISVLRREVSDGPWEWRLLSSSADGKAVYEYTNGTETLIGKFCPNGKGEQSYRALQRLCRVPGKYFGIPQPVVYDHRLHLLITEKAVGTTCQGMQLPSTANRLQRIGRALQELHTCKLQIGKQKQMEDHLQELIRPSPMVLADSLPRHADVIRKTLDDLRAKQHSWKNIATSPIHRDFHLRQLFDSGSRITVVDWDLSAQGDPAFDLAYFTTYLINHYPANQASSGVESFLAGYQPSSELLDRLETYQRFNYLRRACRRYRLKDANWEMSLNQMIARLN